jgi:hypothetical protein
MVPSDIRIIPRPAVNAALALALLKYKLPDVSTTLAVYNLFQVLDVMESAIILFADVDPVKTESETVKVAVITS